MTQLRSCYFCGTTGALSEYATLPNHLRTDDEQSPRVVLCDRCHTKLTNVLSPIVEQLPGGPSEASKSTVAPGDGGGSTPDSSVEGSSPPPADQPEVTFSASSSADDEADGADESDDPGEADGAERGDSPEADADDGDDGDDAEDSETTDESVDAAASDDSPASQNPDEVADSSADDSPAAPSTGTDDRLERVYHQFLRFLRNREFPVPRTEAKTIAQSAYDLSAAEASEVIQLTIDRNVLDERDGELHRR